MNSVGDDVCAPPLPVLSAGHRTDAMRSMLDSLMGTDRNFTEEERVLNKKEIWDPEVRAYSIFTHIQRALPPPRLAQLSVYPGAL